MADTKLVAKTRVKFGGAATRDVRTGFMVQTEPPTEVEPGAEFTAPAELAEELVAIGAAVKPEDAKAERRANMTNEERAAELRAELSTLEAEMGVNPLGGAHLAGQTEEEQRIKKAQEDAKKSGGAPGNKKADDSKGGDPAASGSTHAGSDLKTEPKGDNDPKTGADPKAGTGDKK